MQNICLVSADIEFRPFTRGFIHVTLFAWEMHLEIYSPAYLWLEAEILVVKEVLQQFILGKNGAIFPVAKQFFFRQCTLQLFI